LAGYKLSSVDDIARTADIVRYVHREMEMHKKYCASFGLSQRDIESSPEDIATTAYTRFVLDIGQSQDFFALQVAMAPCLIGYQAIARRLEKQGVKDSNMYWEWVESYAGKDYAEAVIKGRELLERYAQDVGVKRVEGLVDIFARATKVSFISPFERREKLVCDMKLTLWDSQL
jgi:thiaminase